MVSKLGYDGPQVKISWKSAHNFLNYPKQLNKEHIYNQQTDTNGGNNIHKHKIIEYIKWSVCTWVSYIYSFTPPCIICTSVFHRSVGAKGVSSRRVTRLGTLTSKTGAHGIC